MESNKLKLNYFIYLFLHNVIVIDESLMLCKYEARTYNKCLKLSTLWVYYQRANC